MQLKREQYLKQIRPYYDSDIIKVITGVRRSGKSVLLDTIRGELIENGIQKDHVIYLNLEDLDYDYIEAMEYGMPPISGWGMGIDRIVQLITNSDNIKDVVLFPLMKNKEDINR